MGKDIQKYFKELNDKLTETYKIAEKARAKNIDPSDRVEIIPTKNVAERVEGLVSVVAPQIKNSGIIERIQELEKKYGFLDWRVAFKIGEEIAKENFCKFKDKKEAIEVGMRAGFAYLTLGVVASPLEGFIEFKIRKRKDGKEYIAIFYAGPVRSAGGTAGAASVVLADYIRKKLGYEKYDPTEKEIKRASTEILDFHERVTNLQYFPSKKEIEFLARNLPVQIDGDPTEKKEVSNYKDLSRIETNEIRGGFCLVMAECLAQKAQKIHKQLSLWGKEFDIEWDFLEELLKIKKEESNLKKEKTDRKIQQDYTFLKELAAGRPILTYPLAKGGFRLRYGRTRASGLSAQAIHPATMAILNNYIAIGTQLKVERPSKGTALTSCDSIDGPIVKLKNGDVIYLSSEEEAKKIKNEIEEILFLGDILINYGDFFNRASVLVPCGYNEEWWLQQVLKKDKSFQKEKKYNISLPEAEEISNNLNVPLYPKYIYYWSELSIKDLSDLIDWLDKAAINKEIILPYIDEHLKRILELIGMPHKNKKEHIIIEEQEALALKLNLGLNSRPLKEIKEKIKKEKCLAVLDLINKISDFIIKDKSGTTIGARMGRPEKAKLRKLKTSPQSLFPVGEEGGRFRSLQSAVEKVYVTGEFPIFFCNKCGKNTIFPTCETCNSKTEKRFYCKQCNIFLEKNKCKKDHIVLSYNKQKINIAHYFKTAIKKLNLKNYPELTKGVKGTSNKNHVPENLVKGILRSKYNLYVNKDGTIRYDITELPLTHFKPKEIRTMVSKLKELGYEKDIYGKELVSDDQLIEIKPQDVILPSCKESAKGGDEESDKVLFRVTKFLDELLSKVYGINRFYNLKNENDLIGHLILSLAPHTSAGVVGRIIGFSETQGCFAHPLWHSAHRRDADGDEVGVMLLLDGLLNFSKEFLPSHRGGAQDAPLILISQIIPAEVDDMVFDIDRVWEYPLELYEAAESFKMPWDVKIEQLKEKLGTEEQYENYGFTHSLSNINYGTRYSAYKSLPTMQEKVLGQMELAEKIRAVDESDVAKLVIEKHFLKDIKGNLRKFSTQQFRCVKCNEKYRRPPLIGKCIKCSGNIIFTVSEGTVIKYLEPCMELARRYNLPSYLKQNLELTKRRIEGVFGKEKEKQEGLNKWFS